MAEASELWLTMKDGQYLSGPTVEDRDIYIILWSRGGGGDGRFGEKVGGKMNKGKEKRG